MEMPDKTMLRAFASRVSVADPLELRRAAAKFLHDLAKDEEPEVPKVESKEEGNMKTSKAEVDELLGHIGFHRGRELWSARVCEILRWVRDHQADEEQEPAVVE